MNRRSLLQGAALAGLATPAGATTLAAPQLIERFAAALTAHDMTAFAALFAEGYVNHQDSAAAPPAPPGRGMKQATVALFAARLTGLPDLRVEVEEAVITANRVAGSFRYTGTHTGPYLGVAPTGRVLRFTSCDIFRVEDGLLAEHWGMGDLAGLMAQLKV